MKAQKVESKYVLIIKKKSIKIWSENHSQYHFGWSEGKQKHAKFLFSLGRNKQQNEKNVSWIDTLKNIQSVEDYKQNI